MNDYTPTTEQVREDYATRMAPHLDEARREAFDRWLEQVKAEAKADALTDAGLLARPLPTREEIADVILAESLFGSRTPIAAANAVLDLLKGREA